LGGVTEKGHNVIDDLLHAVKFDKGGIGANHPVGEQAAESLVGTGVEQHRVADRVQQAFVRGGIHLRVIPAKLQILQKRQFLFSVLIIERFIPAQRGLCGGRSH
jgi:hypothetical protein